MSLQKDFQIITKLGQGAYSTVYKVLRLQDQKIYALKKVKLFNLSNKQKQNSLNEIRILASIDNEHVISYKEAFFDQETQSLCMIMQFANNGDLLRRINQKIKNSQFFSEQEIWKMFISIVKGLKCLHDRKILHRDIKTANIFLNDDVAKLGDLNVSKVSEEGLCQTQTGTPYYASPQVWNDQPYNQKSDIWSLGCILYETICLKPPFFSDDLEQLYKKVHRGIYSKIPSSYSSQLASLIRLLLQVNPEQRPSCQKILQLKYVKKHILPVQNDQNNNIQQHYQGKQKLLKTIKITQNMAFLNNQLPRSKYQSSVQRKQMKSLARNPNQSTSSHQQIKEYWSKTKKSLKQITQMQQLPVIENDINTRKTTPLQNSQRTMVYSKNSHSLLPTRQRKKSQLQLYQKIKAKRNLQSQRGSQNSNQNQNLRQQILQLRLPKVYNRVRKNSQKIVSSVGISSHSKSLRSYKAFN